MFISVRRTIRKLISNCAKRLASEPVRGELKTGGFSMIGSWRLHSSHQGFIMHITHTFTSSAYLYLLLGLFLIYPQRNQ
jgi:hypothetical protein